MVWKGPCLAIQAGFSNQSGTKRITIPGGENVERPDVTTTKEKLNKIFVGNLINLSYKRYMLTDSEAVAFTGVNPARYTLVNYAISFGKYGRKGFTVRDFYAGFDKAVSAGMITTWVLANRKMHDGTAPEFCIVGRAIPVV